MDHMGLVNRAYTRSLTTKKRAPTRKMTKASQVAPTAGMAEASVSAGKYDSFVENATIPRFGRPEDVARAVRFFLEPDNYITGQVLNVSGGWLL